MTLYETEPHDSPNQTRPWEGNSSPTETASWQTALVDISRRLMTPSAPAELMADATRLAAETVGAQMYGTTQLRPDGKSLSFRLYNLADGDAAQAEETILPADPAHSLAFRAIQASYPLLTPQLGEANANDRVLEKHELHSAIHCGLTNENQAFGALGVYGASPQQFDAQDAMFCETIASLLTMNIAYQHVTRHLEEQQGFSESLLEGMDSPVVTLSPDGRLKQVNRAATAVSGFTEGELRGRPLWNALLIPEEMKLVKDAFQRLKMGETPVRVETFILTKHGDRRRIAWSFTSVADADGKLASLVGAGSDITRQHEMMEELRKLRAENRDARSSLEQLHKKIANQEIVLEEHGERSRSSDAPQPERRQISRRTFPYLQFVAAMPESQLPPAEDFQEVRCRDISASGFAYLCTTRPSCQRLVVAFGSPPSLVYLTAVVRHVTRVTLGGEPMHLIGCEYTGRAAY